MLKNGLFLSSVKFISYAGIMAGISIILYCIYVIIFFSIIKNIKFYSNNVIFGIISKISVNKSMYFFQSLKKVKYRGKIIIFVDKRENTYNYKQLDIEYLYYNYSFPFYPINHHKYHVDISFIKKNYPNLEKIKKHNFFVWIVRYYMIYTFIKYYGRNDDTYLLTDIKDVLFQDNPFSWKHKRGIYLVEESKIKSLKESTFGWMKPYTVDDNILQNRVINGGIIFGSSKEIKQFLKDYIHGYKQEGKYGIDQAYLNFFYYSKLKYKYPLYVCESNKCFAKCIIQEIRYTASMIINQTDMKIYNGDGSIPSLIHQYTYAYIYPPSFRQKLFEKYRKIRSS